jgi:hypothetical protein
MNHPGYNNQMYEIADAFKEFEDSNSELLYENLTGTNDFIWPFLKLELYNYTYSEEFNINEVNKFRISRIVKIMKLNQVQIKKNQKFEDRKFIFLYTSQQYFLTKTKNFDSNAQLLHHLIISNSRLINLNNNHGSLGDENEEQMKIGIIEMILLYFYTLSRIIFNPRYKKYYNKVTQEIKIKKLDKKTAKTIVRRLKYHNFKVLFDLKYFKKNISKNQKVAFIESASYGFYSHINRYMNEFGIKTIELQHGVINGKTVFYHHGTFMFNNKSLLPEYIFVFGEYYSKLINSPSKILVVGSKQMENIAAKYIGGITKNGAIVVATNGINLNSMYNLILDLLRLDKKLEITLQIHPREVSKLERNQNRYLVERKVRISTSEFLYKNISESEFIVTELSTVATDALYLSKKVLMYNNTEDANYPASLVGKSVKNAMEIYKVMNDSNYIFVEDHLLKEKLWKKNVDENFINAMKEILVEQ